jgi:hypothetical protein
MQLIIHDFLCLLAEINLLANFIKTMNKLKNNLAAALLASASQGNSKLKYLARWEVEHAGIDGRGLVVLDRNTGGLGLPFVAAAAVDDPGLAAQVAFKID